MTLYSFNKLDEIEQHEVIWADGVNIGERNDGEHKVVLYQLYSFYVELYYHIEYDVLRRLKSFSNTALLDDYLPTNTIIL